MKYVELNISVTDPMQAEILTALLSDYPFEAFAEEDGALKAYIQEADYDECHNEVEQIIKGQEVDFAASPVVQQNWNAEWESGFEPVEVAGERPILIRAPHHAPAQEGVIDVVIAPRMSFGTGHHATTALMSQTIASMGFEGKRGLDMGCGTGVLAIVALKCGAEQMTAVDIDDWACDSCRDSIALSGVESKVDVRCGSIEQVVAGEKYDFILANINRNILQMMMPHFSRRIKEGGQLLMSGFLSEDVVHISASALEYGFAIEEVKERDEWIVMICRKE